MVGRLSQQIMSDIAGPVVPITDSIVWPTSRTVRVGPTFSPHLANLLPPRPSNCRAPPEPTPRSHRPALHPLWSTTRTALWLACRPWQSAPGSITAFAITVTRRYAWVFFVAFIIVTSLAVVNLFIEIIGDAMQPVQEEPREADRAEFKTFTHKEIEALHARFDKLQHELAKLTDTSRESAKATSATDTNT
jgi:hypothetical protein